MERLAEWSGMNASVRVEWKLNSVFRKKYIFSYPISIVLVILINLFMELRGRLGWNLDGIWMWVAHLKSTWLKFKATECIPLLFVYPLIKSFKKSKEFSQKKYTGLKKLEEKTSNIYFTNNSWVAIREFSETHNVDCLSLEAV